MYENFEALPDSKKKRIIDVCLEEFAKNGYDKASTNAITKKAGISKGILFHYFGNKKNLYLYLVNYVMDFMIKKFYGELNDPPYDIMERLMERGMKKLQLAYEYPDMYELLFGAFVSTPRELQDEVRQMYTKFYSYNTTRFFSDFDTSKFRKDIDPKKAIEVIALFLEGYSNKYLNAYKDIKPGDVLASIDKLMEESREYLEILKKGIYE